MGPDRQTASRADERSETLVRRSLERIDHTHGLEGFHCGHILRVENVDASIEARRENEGVP